MAISAYLICGSLFAVCLAIFPIHIRGMVMDFFERIEAIEEKFDFTIQISKKEQRQTAVGAPLKSVARNKLPFLIIGVILGWGLIVFVYMIMCLAEAIE
jgi:hypothetical protein